jgi:adenylate cyclase
MRLICTYQGKSRVVDSAAAEIIFGRADGRFPIGLDLAPDPKVSRLHGRIWFEAGTYWIEDLGSSRGTQLNGVELKGRPKQQLRSSDEIVAGDTTMRVESLRGAADVAQTNYLAEGTALLSSKNHSSSTVSISHDLDAQESAVLPSLPDAQNYSARLNLICDLPLQFAAKVKLESLLPLIVDRLMEVFPEVESWALVLHDPTSDSLLLKAYRCAHHPNVSETLARRAMRDKKAFIWKNVPGDVSQSIVQSSLEIGMYAPLLWQGEALGVICGGMTFPATPPAEHDLRLLVLVAQYAAMAVAGHRLQAEISRQSAEKSNLLRQFSPKVAERLISHRGKLKLGGERSQVTVLNADMRGFTKLSMSMDPDDVVQMLNHYFEDLVPAIFSNQGTVDKFVGDAILAVFGSPEADPQQQRHAVQAALEMQAAVAKVNELDRLRGAASPQFGIGIHYGEVIHGFVGTADRMEFTVIGDAVNRASRYCSAAEAGQVLISPEVYERIWSAVEAERLSIKTKEGDFVAYKVNALKSAGEAPIAVPKTGSGN